MNFFLARQPIFDTHSQVYGYELLYRENAENQSYAGDNADMATAKTLYASFYNIGLDHLTGGKRAFVNFTSNLLEQEIASLLPQDKLVIEILEDIEPTETLFNACCRLKENGYMLALDDFEYRSSTEPLIGLADIVKLDFLKDPSANMAAVRQLRPDGDVIFLAEKLETAESVNFAREMGCTLFQGYFFQRPVTVTGKTIDPTKHNFIQLIWQLRRPDIQLEKVAQIIRRDVALTYKLLRLVNSPGFGVIHNVKNIQHALALMGTNEVRRWLLLLAVRGLSSSKPSEVVYSALIRGHFMEGIGFYAGLGNRTDDLFLTGMLSLIDVLLECPLEEALNQIHVDPSVRNALLYGKGRLAKLLDLARSYESGQWDRVSEISEALMLQPSVVSDQYVDSVIWCGSLWI